MRNSWRMPLEAMLLFTLIIVTAAFFVLNWAASPQGVQGVIDQRALKTAQTAPDLIQTETGIASDTLRAALLLVIAGMILAALLTLVALLRPAVDQRSIWLRAVLGGLMVGGALISRREIGGIEVDFVIRRTTSGYDASTDPIYVMGHAFYIAVIGAVLLIIQARLPRQRHTPDTTPT